MGRVVKQSKKARVVEESEEEEVFDEPTQDEEMALELEDGNEDEGLDSDEERQAINNSLAGRAMKAMNAADRERKISDIVRCILKLNASGIAVKRDSIKKECFTSERDKNHAKAINALVFYASKKLDQVFGMKLVDVPVGKEIEAAAAAYQDDSSAMGTQTGTKQSGNKTFVVMNTLSHEQKDVAVSLSAKENAEMGLLMFLLAMIHMGGNCLMNVPLFKHLKVLGIYEKRKHQVFGNISQVLKDFQKEKFILINKLTQNDGKTCTEYKWGPRAYKELSVLDVYEFVAEMFGEDADTGLLKKLEQLKRKEVPVE